MSTSPSTPAEPAPAAVAPRPAAASGGGRKWFWIALKVVLSILVLFEIYRRTFAREGAEEALARLGALRWEWFAAAVAMQLLAISCGVVRWRVLLLGQGMRTSWGFLGTSWMIGRFWGAVTPGGLGLDGWRLYETTRYSGKLARATALAGVEKILGQLGFGIVVLFGSVFGLEFIGVEGLVLVNGFFLVLVAAGMTLLARPHVFRRLASVLPARVQPRVATLVEAVCAYQGRGRMIATAALLGTGVHAFNNLIYVCAARALGIELHPGAVFFASSLQIMATLLPTSINGIGLREAAAVALYTSAAIGLSMSEAVLIPTVGFAAEMTVSATGVLFFLLARREGYAPAFEVSESDGERVAAAQIPEVSDAELPQVRRYAELGLGAGLLAGLLLGLAEGGLVISGGRTDTWVLAYGVLAYSLFFGAVGVVAGAGLGWAGRFARVAAGAEPLLYGRLSAALFAGAAFGIGAFRIRRDVFHEELAWKSAGGLGVLLGCLACAALVFLVLSTVLRLAAGARPLGWLLRAWGTPALVGAVVAVLVPTTLAMGAPARAALPPVTANAPEDAGNVLVIVVDTLRADHLPAYGYETGRTPNLDAFARDAIRFDQAFSNASWTRPSFASILSGRYASSHGVMAKTDALPDELTTLAEAYREGGYDTTGIVTNYNVAPYFNFDQGFDQYHYLSPDFVLGADDSAAKLLLVQFLRQRIEGMRDAFFGVQPGTAYQDAATVNRRLLSALDAAPANRPWMMFVGYMDPHDPYYAHPYDGEAYSRAAHPSPGPDEAEHLRALYDGEITYWDEQFGQLVAELQRRGLYDDLTIVVTSDHGEEFGEHGGFFHGTTLYDEQVRVPLFVKLPSSRRGGTTVRHWVQSIDLMPTLLRESGLEVPAGVQGGDLFTGSDRLFAEESHEGNVLEAVRERRGTDEIKLITANEGNPRRLPTTELFRVDLDPGEREDLSSGQPELLQHARHALEAAHVRASEGAVEGQEVELDEASRRQLCELGYLTGEACER
jgi:arylsulfatase A-like enzyme/uncharacterized membrane protein YbhN (UPF0104 family)